MFTDTPTEELAEMLDAYAEDYITCPHCDGLLHRPTNYCWCAGCDACERAWEADRRYSAACREYERRFPPVETRVTSRPAAIRDDYPF